MTPIPKKGTPERIAYFKAIASKGGKNKRGVKTKNTIDREAVLELAKDIIAGRTKRLIDTQSILAIGCIKVFVIHTYYEGTGKNRKKMKSKPELVTKDNEIVDALNHEFNDGNDPSNEDDYYFVMTREPENVAIDSLLNRTFGRATENTKITVDKPIGILLDELEAFKRSKNA